jgi:hypothetical protein
MRGSPSGFGGLITGQDWRRPDLQRKYGGYFAWFLLEKIRAQG